MNVPRGIWDLGVGIWDLGFSVSSSYSVYSVVKMRMLQTQCLRYDAV